nr:hypothetical protein [Microbacterium barkeri]
MRAFAELGERIGVRTPTALATLPFARRRQRMVSAERVRVEATASARSSVGPSTTAGTPTC